jgi:hypothetical protein
MQDAENVAVPEAAEERAEPARQQPASESPPTDEAAGSGGSEVGQTEDAEEDAEAGPEPEVRAKPAAQSEEETATSPAASPTPQSAERSPSQEPSAPGKAEAVGEQARGHPSAGAEEEGGSDGSAAEAEPRALENGEADEPSFSDPEDFVDDVSEEGKGDRVPGQGARSPGYNDLVSSTVGDHLGSPFLRQALAPGGWWRAGRTGLSGGIPVSWPRVSRVDQLLCSQWFP